MTNCDRALDRALRKSTDIYVRCDVILVGSIDDIINLVDYGYIPMDVDRPSFSESILTDVIRQDWTDMWDEYPDFS